MRDSFNRFKKILEAVLTKISKEKNEITWKINVYEQKLRKLIFKIDSPCIKKHVV